MRVTAFATNTATGGPGTQLPDLELPHRRQARAEDRIRIAKDTGLTNLPLYDFAQNQIWCALVALTFEITAWMQLLALTHDARRWEPKRLRHRLFTVPATLARTGRRIRLRLAQRSTWAELLADAIHRLRALAVPADRQTTRWTLPATPRTLEPRPPETTPGTPSHPDDTIRTNRRHQRRNHDQQVSHANLG